MTQQKTLLVFLSLLSLSTFVFAAKTLELETTPPPSVGAITIEELGPVLAHPLPSDESPAGPQMAERTPTKNDLRALFEQEKPAGEERNPLEDEAQKELAQMGQG